MRAAWVDIVWELDGRMRITQRLRDGLSSPYHAVFLTPEQQRELLAKLLERYPELQREEKVE